jgi:cellulose synthase/poly-beta-1,6-N-acetylglucosamine synthase-like glycosyltransferase
MIKAIFWILVSSILYVYFGYPLILIILDNFKPKSVELNSNHYFPSVSLFISAYNEEKNIKKKIENSLQIDYPKEKIEIVVVSDSNDGTNDIIRKYAHSGVKLVIPEKRKGKIAAQNYTLPKLNGEIIIITDADTFCAANSVKKLVRHFSDKSVGSAIAKVVWINKDDNLITKGGDLYYRYELFIREKESNLGILGLGSTGLMAFPKRLFTSIPHFLAEDTFLPLYFLRNGYKVVYEPESLALTMAASDIEGECRIRERNANIDTHAVLYMKDLLNPIRHFGIFFMLLSHKLGRWLIPFFMPIILGMNFLLRGRAPYDFILLLQSLFYSLAIFGYIFCVLKRQVKYLQIPYYFCLINFAASVGFLKAVFGRKQTMWQPVRN